MQFYDYYKREKGGSIEHSTKNNRGPGKMGPLTNRTSPRDRDTSLCGEPVGIRQKYPLIGQYKENSSFFWTESLRIDWEKLRVLWGMQMIHNIAETIATSISGMLWLVAESLRVAAQEIAYRIDTYDPDDE